MNRYIILPLLLFVGIICCCSPSFANQTNKLVQDKLAEYEKVQSKGAQLAQEFSKITGCAINPLAGICAIGAYTYLTTPQEQRKNLPWYATVHFLAVMSSVLGLLFVKDSSKAVIPKVLSIPLDAIEHLTEKPITPFIAVAMLLTDTNSNLFREVQNIAASFFCSDAVAATLGASSEALPSIAVNSITLSGSILAILTIFIVIFVVNQAFNFLVFLCPFNAIDFLLISTKNLLFATVIGLSIVSPYLGAALSLIIFIICLIIFSFAFRMTVFGYITAFDFVSCKILKRRHADIDNKLFCFSGTGIQGVPRLSAGYIEKQDETLLFTYRPWFIFSSRQIVIAERENKVQLVKKLITLRLDILIHEKGKVQASNLAQFPSRYQGIESKLAAFLGASILPDNKIASGIKGIIAWLRKSDNIAQTETPS